MDCNSTFSRGMRKTKHKMLALFLLAVAITFVGTAIGVSESISAQGEHTITYIDPTNTTGNGSVEVTYDGIAATEYNPLLWSNTGLITSGNWNAPSNTAVCEFIDGNSTPVTTSGTRDNWTGTVKLNSDGSFNSYENSLNHVVKIQDNSVSIMFTHDGSAGSGIDYEFKIPKSFVIKENGITATSTTVTKNESKSNTDPIYDYYNFHSQVTETTVTITFTTCTLSPDKVFGGWMAYQNNEWVMIYPGDVVDSSITTLYAKWIEPDVFVLKSDTVYANRWADGDCYTVDVLSPCAYPTNIQGNKTIGAIDIDNNKKVNYADVVRGNKRTSSDMFGTIYLLTLEKARNGEKLIDMTVGGVNNSNYPNYLPTGTYRSPIGAIEKTVLQFSGSGTGCCRLGGDVIIDNVIIVSTGSNIGTHGDGTGSAIYAYGHKLILGTGIENLWKKVNNGIISDTTTNIPNDNGGVPQIFGGTPGSSITNATIVGKKIVFGGGEEIRDFTVDLGTYVIIHSGTYYNIVGGSSGANATIGTQDNPLSTYIVLKGGITTDTLAGGSSGSGGSGDIYGNIYNTNNDSEYPSENNGGTFVYCVGHYTPGDNWEDTQTNDFYGERTKFYIEQSSIIEGGSSKGTSGNKATIEGSTHVFVSGNSSVWDVQASGRSEFTRTDSAYLELTGKAIIRHIACGIITDGATTSDNDCVDHVLIYIGGRAVAAGVYGAGYDTSALPTYKSMLDGDITVRMVGGIVGNLYGGGYRGSIGNESNKNDLTINIEITGGTIFDSVYGGGSGGLDKDRHNSTGNFVEPSWKGYKNSTGKSYVFGNINISIGGDSDINIYGDVYGGGMSVPTLTNYKGKSLPDEYPEVAKVDGNISISIGNNANIAGSVYGGGKGIDEEKSADWADDYSRITVVNSSLIDYNDPTANPFNKLPWFVNNNTNITYNTTSGHYVDNAKVTGNTYVLIKDGCYIGHDVYGGGAIGKVDGNTVVEVTGGEIKGNVFGGGFGVEKIISVTGNRTVYVTGSSTRIYGSVYGGSSKGDDGPKLNNDTDETVYDNDTTIVVIDQGTIDGSVFGGGFMGRTYGNTNIYVGHYYKDDEGNYVNPYQYKGSVKTINVSSIYAGANVKTDEQGHAENPFGPGTDLVKGHGSIFIYGNEGKAKISIDGSIMGSGNACNTKLSTKLEIIQLQNNTNTPIQGIHRITEALITQSYIEVQGRSAVTEELVASLYMIDDLTLKYDTIVKIDSTADKVLTLNSVNMYNKPTTQGSPSNSIIIAGGSTFYIRESSSSYGAVNGNLILSAQGESSYGAYVMCSPGSGGFVVNKDGSFRAANMTDFNESTRCWYIGGTEKKAITMSLSTSGSDAIKTVDGSVDIVKMFNGTAIEYVGGAFYSLGSDIHGHDYEFVKPGMNGGQTPHENQFGLIFGHEGNGATLTVANEMNSFEGIPGFENPVKSTYYNRDNGQEDQSVLLTCASAPGTYKLNFTLTGAPVDHAAYLGYLILNFREVSAYGDEGYTIPANYIEVRVDFYVITSSTEYGTDYSISVKTEENPSSYIGYSDVLFPKSPSMSELKLTKVTGINAGTTVRVIPMANMDNTTGWMLSSPKEFTDNFNEDGSQSAIKLGTLSGSSVATIRYYVEYSGDVPQDITLSFVLDTGSGQSPSNITLIVSEKNKVKVTFVGMYGTKSNQSALTFYQGQTVSKIECPDTGEGFVGWYTDENYTKPYNHDTPVTKDLTLYARYMYTVNLDYMDGRSLKIYVSQDVEGGASLTNLPEPEKAGYVFGGWYKDSSFIYKWNTESDRVTKDMPLYAKWSGIEIKINFFKPSGSGWTNIFGTNGYVMNYVNGEPVYASVRIGSTFDIVDFNHNNMNILDYAREVLTSSPDYSQKFIQWESFQGNNTTSGTWYNIDQDTILTMAMLTNPDTGLLVNEINIYAVTSDIAIKVTMDKKSWNETSSVPYESATVEAPSSFLVYPDQSVAQMEGDETYFTFTYTLKDASLSGYKLKGWHNTKMPTNVGALDPRPGVERTLKIFYVEEHANVGGDDVIYLKIVRTEVETVDETGRAIIVQLDNGTTDYYLNKKGSDYEITYKAVWEQMNYSVSIPSPINGTVDAFLVDHNGNRERITSTTISAHYGDIIELSYTPSEHYELNRWIASGECNLEDAYSSFTTVMVTGNCTITASEIGSRFVNLNMIFNNNTIEDSELQKTRVYLHNKVYTQEYYEMSLKSNDPSAPKLYSGYIPLGLYEVCLQYGDSDEYLTLLGDLSIDRDNNADFTYYIISAKIITEEVTVESTPHQTTSNYKYSILNYTKYVGALDSLIFSQPQDLLINNPDGNLPPVKITVAAGYSYTVLEGLYETEGEVTKFIVNTDHNYHTGSTNEIPTPENDYGTKTESFYLNWTKFDKPALIVVETQNLYQVKYKLKNEDGTDYKVYSDPVEATTSVDYGAKFLPNVPASIYQALGGSGKIISGWYFDCDPGSETKFSNQVYGFHEMNDARLIQAKSGTLILYGKVVTGTAKDVNVVLKLKELDGSYSEQEPMKVPLVENDGKYSAAVGINVEGMKFSGMEPYTKISAELVGQRIVITAVDSTPWEGSTTPTLYFNYTRNTVSIEIENSDKILSWDWNPSDRAAFEQEIPLPIMKRNSHNDPISGWTADPAEGEVIYKNGNYYYRVGASNDGATISLTAHYPDDTAKVTFITPVSSFKANNSQRLVVATVEGKVTQPLINTYDTNMYQFLGFFNGDVEFDFNSTVTSDLIITLKWKEDLSYKFTYSTDAHASVSTTITKPAEDGVYMMTAHSEIVISIKPDAGYDLDIERTLSESGLTAYDIGTPTKLSNNRGYAWTFFITKDINLNIVTKTASADINFIVNGTKVDDFTVYYNDVSGNGQNIPLYSVITFGMYNDEEWYYEPIFNEQNKVESTIIDGKRVYTLTVKEDISLYTTSSSHIIRYFDWDGTLLYDSGKLNNGTITLRDIECSMDGHIFVGWALLDSNGKKVYTHIPKDTVELGVHTPTIVNLYAFYIKDGNVTYTYDGSKHYSSIENDPALNQLMETYKIDVHYCGDDKIITEGPYDATNPNGSFKYPKSGSSFSFSTIGEGADANSVYYAGVIVDASGDKMSVQGKFVVKITPNKKVMFYDGGSLKATIEIADYQNLGDLPEISKDMAIFEGWFVGETKLTASTTGSELTETTTIAEAKWTNIYTVTFDPTGGVLPQGFPGTVREDGKGTISVQDGQTINNPGNATRTYLNYSYDFEGWIKSASDTDGQPFVFGVTEIHSNLTLVADWSIGESIPYWTIEYYGLVGGNNLQKIHTSYIINGDKITDAGDPPAQRGLGFEGWFKIKLAETPSGYIILEDEPYDYNTPVTSDFKLFPVRSLKSYDVTIDPNYEGSTTTSAVGGLNKGPISLSVSREGYNLLGWSFEKNGNVVWTGQTISFPLQGSYAALDPADRITITLYAIWEGQTRTVTFNSNGGTSVETQYVEYGGYATAPSAPLKKDSKFLGWYLNGNVFNFDTPITTNIVLTAQWSDTYTVTLDLDGGSIAYDRTFKVASGTSLNSVIGEPNKTNTQFKIYDFAGWQRLTDDGYVDYDPSQPITSDISLKAKWTVTTIAWSVGYYAAYGGESPQLRSVAVVNVDAQNKKVSAPADPPGQRGLKFTGWYEFRFISESPGYEVIDRNTPFDFANTDIERDYLLVAGWMPISYTVTLDPNYEGAQSTTRDLGRVYGANIPMILSRDGFAFQGWSATPDGEILYKHAVHFPLDYDIGTMDESGDRLTFTLYAQWGTDYKVTFNYNNGTPIQTQTVAVGGKVIQPEDPTWEGNRFLYWYDKEGNDAPFDFDTVINSSVDLVAKWQKQCTVTFMSNDTVYYSAIVDSGKKISAPAEPINDTYNFKYWHLQGEDTPFDFRNTVIEEDMVFIAEWEKKPVHIVRFYAQPEGVPELKATIEVIDGQLVEQPADPPVPERMQFIGWYEFTTGQTRSVSVVITDKFYFNQPVTRDYDLVAAWDIEVYTIVFHANDGTDRIVTEMHEPVFGAPIILPSQGIIREGMSFVGWSNTADSGVDYPGNIMNRPIPKIESKTLDLYAVWTSDIVVTFDSNGGSAVEQKVIQAGTKVEKPEDPTWEGYTFKGWYLGDRLFNFDTTITENITLVAKWISGDDPIPAPQNPKDIKKETEIIEHEDGSTTRIDKETITERDGSKTEIIKEKTTYEDGSSFERDETTYTDRYGNVTTETKETVTTKDGRGNNVEESVRTVTDGETSKTEERLVVTDDAGRIVEENVKIINTDAEGHQVSFVIVNDGDKAEAYLPDTSFDVLREAETILDEMKSMDVDLVFSSADGVIIIPSDYLKEATIRSYTISLDNNEKRVTLDEATVKNLSSKGGDAILSIKKLNPEDLTERQRAIIHDNYAMALTITINGDNISALGGNATVSVLCDKPYDHLYYVSDNGAIEEIECSYDAATGIMTFKLEHFSVYTLTVGPLAFSEEEDLMMFVAIAAAALVVVIIAGALIIRKR
ncbi:MAG: hypothetical protein E7Z62_06265 [Thermoplasmata archaeon]|nr:hypothetical protein [Thermoplasmata archaeon]